MNLKVKEYLKSSSNVDVENPSPITTIRNSAKFYKKWLEEISPETNDAVREITHDSPLMGFFDPYY